ncbi:hypothetical protein SLA2020_382040 [Shorea laevis]
MDSDNSERPAIPRYCIVLGQETELLEIHADRPIMNVLFIPGNPGVVYFYKEFVEALFKLLEGKASIIAIGHIGQTKENGEPGRLFSLQEQIDHKVHFIEQELQTIEIPLILVGHSTGSYIALQMLRRSPEKYAYCIGLYPFLALNPQSKKQTIFATIARNEVLSIIISSYFASLGWFPRGILRFIAKCYLGRSSSNTALEAACSYLTQYHTMRNVLFMARTIFREVAKPLDWEFMRANQNKIAFLFGIDDQWGPLELFMEICQQVQGSSISIDGEGHRHAFSCSEAGSLCVAGHVANFIKNNPAIAFEPV